MEFAGLASCQRNATMNRKISMFRLPGAPVETSRYDFSVNGTRILSLAGLPAKKETWMGFVRGENWPSRHFHGVSRMTMVYRSKFPSISTSSFHIYSILLRLISYFKRICSPPTWRSIFILLRFVSYLFIYFSFLLLVHFSATDRIFVEKTERRNRIWYKLFISDCQFIFLFVYLFTFFPLYCRPTFARIIKQYGVFFGFSCSWFGYYFSFPVLDKKRMKGRFEFWYQIWSSSTVFQNAGSNGCFDYVILFYTLATSLR